MALVMKNYELKSYGEFLYGLELKGKESRMRSRFLSLLEKQGELIEKEREVLLQDYGKKDENGNVMTQTDENGKQFAIIGDVISYNYEISKLMEEDFVVTVDESNKEMIKCLQDVVLNLDLVFSGFEAERYDRLCIVLESVNLD